MADQSLSRTVSARKNCLRSEIETQRTIDFLLAQLTRQQDRLDATRLDLEDAHEQIIGLGAALDDALGRIAALEAEDARLREAR